MPQSKQAIEIYAATYVLDDILKRIDLTPDTKGNGGQGKAIICKVLVLTDSQALVDGISFDKFWEWKNNDFEMS
ncbi:hypothetical protein IFR05_009934 [Cadophora sp. M221]|nr:hypothetical protein IFR05_009934 [Cadophora sp. M221]